MSDSPDVIRANIEQTRRELGGDVDALADKVSPAKIVERQTDKVKGAVGSVRDRLMGTADDVGGNIGDAKDRVVAKAEGNPLAVGLIAFGAGLLLSSLIPASTKEKELAQNVKEQAQPLVDEVADVAKDVGANLKEPAREAAEAVKATAAEAVENVRTDAEYAAGEVKDQARTARRERRRRLTGAIERRTTMPGGRGSNLKDPELYEKLRDDGASKEKAARISNSTGGTKSGRSKTGRKGGESGSYDDWTVPELKSRAKELGLSGYSKKNKGELIDALRSH